MGQELNLSNLLTRADEEGTPSEVSAHKEDYIREMASIAVDVSACQERIIRAGLVYYGGQDRFSFPRARVQKVERGGAVVTYLVEVGRFSVEVRMLNLPYAAELGRTTLSMGTFGQIIETGPGIVAKKLSFQNEQKILDNTTDFVQWKMEMSFEELQALLVQYAFNRICSALQIGPQVRVQPNFDVVCYRNAAQFYLEKCYPVEVAPEKQHLPRILYCLKVMHTFGLIHKDIKPSNIAYSRLIGDLVLLDFGVTSPIREQIGEKTLTHREGTLRFMSRQMLDVGPGSKQYVDLYWNDLFAALKSSSELSSNSCTLESQLLTKISEEQENIEQKMIRYLYALVAEQLSETGPRVLLPVTILKALTNNGFPELLISHALKAGQQIPIKVNAEYLIRSMGLSLRLLTYLENMRNCDYRIDRLMQNIRKGFFPLTEDTLFKQTTIKHILNNFGIMIQKMASMPSPMTANNVRERTKLLFSFADCYFTLGMMSNCAEILKKEQNFQNKVTERQASILTWLIQIIGAPTRLPKSTSLLFSTYMTRKDQLLFIKYILLKHRTGQFSFAYRLAYFLKHRQPTEVETISQNARSETLAIAQQLLANSHIHSCKWLLLFEFVMAELRIAGKHNQILNNYSHLLNCKGFGEARRRIILMKFAEAYRTTGQLEKALKYYRECLDISDRLHSVFDLPYMVNANAVILLLQQLGELEEAINIGYRLFKTASLSMSQPNILVMLHQTLIVCLLDSGQQGQAMMFAESTMLQLPHISMEHTCIWTLLTSQARIVKILGRKDYFKVYLNLAIRKAIEQPVVVDLYSTKSRVELLRIVSDLCAVFDEKKSALQCLDKAIILLLRQMHILNGETESCGKGDLGEQQQFLQPVWLCDQERLHPNTTLCQTLKSFLNEAELFAFYYVLMLLKLRLLDRYIEIVATIRWIKDFPAILRIIESDYSIKGSLNALARNIANQAQYHTALQILEAHRQSSKNDYDYTKAKILHKLGRGKECIDCIEALLQEHVRPSEKERARIEQFLSEVYLEQGNKAEANRHLEQSCLGFSESHRKHPNDVNVMLNLGICYMNLSREKDALVLLEGVAQSQGARNRDDRSESILPLAICLYRVRRFAESLFHLLKSLQNGSNLGADYLFYVLVDCYELRKLRLFKRYLVRLFARDKQRTYVDLLQRLFLRKKPNKFGRLLQLADNLRPQPIPIISLSEIIHNRKWNKQTMRMQLSIRREETRIRTKPPSKQSASV